MKQGNYKQECRNQQKSPKTQAVGREIKLHGQSCGIHGGQHSNEVLSQLRRHQLSGPEKQHVGSIPEKYNGEQVQHLHDVAIDHGEFG